MDQKTNSSHIIQLAFKSICLFFLLSCISQALFAQPIAGYEKIKAQLTSGRWYISNFRSEQPTAHTPVNYQGIVLDFLPLGMAMWEEPDPSTKDGKRQIRGSWALAKNALWLTVTWEDERKEIFTLTAYEDKLELQLPDIGCFTFTKIAPKKE